MKLKDRDNEDQPNQEEQNENEDEYEDDPPPLPPLPPPPLHNPAHLPPAASTRNNPKFGVCCLQGQIRLEYLHPLDDTLGQYMQGEKPDFLVAEFFDHIWCYNAAFAMTSVGATMDQSIFQGTGPYSFKIQGTLHHLTGALLPSENETPKYAQIYIHDSAEQLDIHWRNNANTLNGVVMQDLQDMLHQMHPYTRRGQAKISQIQKYPQLRTRLPKRHTVTSILQEDEQIEADLDLERFQLESEEEIASGEESTSPVNKSAEQGNKVPVISPIEGQLEQIQSQLQSLSIS
ncbi:hypothetical protein D9756_010487 [Leucocoprinus leucothites]|uniref:Uncharacterized protein n=1 Tax=Leucocoprinus leucothites TaxID=201217 RepID=A0A8H5FTK5_9AGAR|nr:hypothetical protein D9756_010487 [Leucoagaricus leucothites]